MFYSKYKLSYILVIFVLLFKSSIAFSSELRFVIQVDPWQENVVKSLCETPFNGSPENEVLHPEWIPCDYRAVIWGTLSSSIEFITSTTHSAMLKSSISDPGFGSVEEPFERIFYIVKPGSQGSVEDPIVTNILEFQPNPNEPSEELISFIAANQNSSLGPVPTNTPMEHIVTKSGFDSFGDNINQEQTHIPEFSLGGIVIRSETMRIISDDSWLSSDTFVPNWENLECSICDNWDFARAEYPSPVSPNELMLNTSAQHIWHDPQSTYDGISGPEQAYFRKSFEIDFPDTVGAPLMGVGIARVSIDDDYELYVNGKLVIENKDNGFADVVDRIDFTQYLRNGKNTIAIHAVDGGWDNPRNRLFERVLFDSYIYSVSHVPADFNNDLCVDRDDLKLMLKTMREPNSTELQTKLDLNGDGVVNIIDARKLVTRFSQVRGVSCYFTVPE